MQWKLFLRQSEPVETIVVEMAISLKPADIIIINMNTNWHEEAPKDRHDLCHVSCQIIRSANTRPYMLVSAQGGEFMSPGATQSVAERQCYLTGRGLNLGWRRRVVFHLMSSIAQLTWKDDLRLHPILTAEEASLLNFIIVISAWDIHSRDYCPEMLKYEGRALTEWDKSSADATVDENICNRPEPCNEQMDPQWQRRIVDKKWGGERPNRVPKADGKSMYHDLLVRMLPNFRGYVEQPPWFSQQHRMELNETGEQRINTSPYPVWRKEERSRRGIKIESWS